MGSGKAGFGNNPRPLNPAVFGNNPPAITPTAPLPLVHEPPYGKAPRGWTRVKLDRAAEKKIQDWADKHTQLENDHLVQYIHLRGNQFLDQWLMQMISAKSDASAPPNDDDKIYWLIALAGNLLWAASCFVPGAGIIKAGVTIVAGVTKAGKANAVVQAAARAAEKLAGPQPGGMSKLGKAMYATMAHGGAFVGSGGIQQIDSQLVGSPQDPSGKDIVASALNDVRKKLGDVLRTNVATWASEIALRENFRPSDYSRDAAKYLQNLDKVLWANLFPGIPFEGLNEMYQSGLKNINQMLADFKAWRQVQKNWARHDATTGRFRDQVDWEKYKERLKYYEENRPFKPHF